MKFSFYSKTVVFNGQFPALVGFFLKFAVNIFELMNGMRSSEGK